METGVFIDQVFNAPTRGHLTPFLCFIHRLFAAAEAYLRMALAHGGDSELHGVFGFIEFQIHAAKIIRQ